MILSTRRWEGETDVDDLGITQIDTIPPPLELTLAEIEALADELMVYHSEFGDLYYRL